MTKQAIHDNNGWEEDDDYEREYEIDDICEDCDRHCSVMDECDECGVVMCAACFEMGAGFCKNHR